MTLQAVIERKLGVGLKTLQYRAESVNDGLEWGASFAFRTLADGGSIGPQSAKVIDQEKT